MLSPETLREAAPKVIHAAVIDDAFDDVQAGEISIDFIRILIQEIGEDPDLAVLFQPFADQIPDLDDVEQEDEGLAKWLNFLWQSTQVDNLLTTKLLSGIFRIRNQKKHQLNDVCSNIEACGIAVTKYGYIDFDRHLDEFETNRYDIVFIDYYLSVYDDESGSDRAINIAKSITQRLEDVVKPVTVLMSSYENVNTKRQEFREQADLTEVGFQFEPKSNLTNQVLSRLKIKSIMALLGYINEVQQYVNELANSSKQAANLFTKEIKSLRLQDYAFIQQARLNDEEHPLGDYMNWLYGSRWSSLLFNREKLRTSQQTLDTMRMETGWLLPEMPSDHVAKLYASALYEEHIGELKAHPLVNTSGLFLNIGDIFSNPELAYVWLVMNPQCDLERTVPLDRSILLLGGELVSLELGHQPSGSINTELFVLDEKSFKIHWNPKKILTVEYGRFAKWMQENSFDRTHRLRLPFALHIQQVMSSSLTRIGLNAPPPLIQSVKTEVWVRDYNNNKNPKKITTFNSGVFRVSLRQDNNDISKIGLTLEFAPNLMESIQRYREELKSLRAEQGLVTLPNPQKDIRRISELILRYDDWFFSNNSFLESNASRSDAIEIAINWKPSQLNTPILLNLITKPSALSINDTNENSVPDETHP